MRLGQTTLEYIIVISVISIAVVAVLYTLLDPIYDATGRTAESLATSLASDGVQ
jgi:type II secretory pathway pseudopilin PulG